MKKSQSMLIWLITKIISVQPSSIFAQFVKAGRRHNTVSRTNSSTGSSRLYWKKFGWRKAKSCWEVWQNGFFCTRHFFLHRVLSQAKRHNKAKHSTPAAINWVDGLIGPLGFTISSLLPFCQSHSQIWMWGNIEQGWIRRVY